MSDTFDFSIPDNNQGDNAANAADSSASGATNNSQPDVPENVPAHLEVIASGEARAERRKRRRAMISAPVRVRGVDVTDDGPDEISTTLDVSRNGILFVASPGIFSAGMYVAVTFPYTKAPGVNHAEQEGRVMRVTDMQNGRCAVALALGVGVGEDLVDAAGRLLFYAPVQGEAKCPRPPDPKRPLVLVVDADVAIRESLKAYLTAESYQVIAVSSADEAHEVLKIFTPALLIAEIEGDDLPGFELCAHVKSTARLQTIPVMLLTSSAYPSDYSNAHSLGAVVCMAKPYRQERLGHIVRLLAPTLEAKQQTAPARPADQTRRTAPKRPAATPTPTRPVKNRTDNTWW
jgi:CheY-like chemotaxis protein